MKRPEFYLLLFALPLSWMISHTDKPASIIPAKHSEVTVDSALYGIWVWSGNENNINILRKSENFKVDESGIAIYPNGVFIKRANAGRCGTRLLPIITLMEDGLLKAILS